MSDHLNKWRRSKWIRIASSVLLVSAFVYITFHVKMDRRTWCERGHPASTPSIHLDPETVTHVNPDSLNNATRRIYEDCLSGKIIGRSTAFYGDAFASANYSHRLGPKAPQVQYSFYIGDKISQSKFTDGNSHVLTLSVNVCSNCETIVRAMAWDMVY